MDDCDTGTVWQRPEIEVAVVAAVVVVALTACARQSAAAIRQPTGP